MSKSNLGIYPMLSVPLLATAQESRVSVLNVPAQMLNLPALCMSRRQRDAEFRGLVPYEDGRRQADKDSEGFWSLFPNIGLHRDPIRDSLPWHLIETK